MTWALLPIKDLVSAKTRLSGILAPSERRALAQAMVEDVLCVLSAQTQIEGILVVSDDPSAELLAHKYGAQLVEESRLGCSGLNGAVTAATAYLAARGATDVVILHGDIPLLQACELGQLLALYAQADTDLVIAPDLAGTGTNVMIMPLAAGLEFHYGPGSCQAHQACAIAAGLRVTLLRNTGMGLDVDDPGDLLHLSHHLQMGEMAPHCTRVLLAADVAQRLLIMERSGLGLESGGEQHDAI